ncbi:hypothetical protein TNCV_176181 [Trichonephila clavipes]|nr:hypothetical protein TNCV_176181 [Trichonephila clavipes]
MSARRVLLRLPLTGNHGRLRSNSAANDRHGQRNGVTLCILKNPASACSIVMVRFEFEDTVSSSKSIGGRSHNFDPWSCEEEDELVSSLYPYGM